MLSENHGQNGEKAAVKGAENGETMAESQEVLPQKLEVTVAWSTVSYQSIYCFLSSKMTAYQPPTVSRYPVTATGCVGLFRSSMPMQGKLWKPIVIWSILSMSAETCLLALVRKDLPFAGRSQRTGARVFERLTALLVILMLVLNYWSRGVPTLAYLDMDFVRHRVLSDVRATNPME